MLLTSSFMSSSQLLAENPQLVSKVSAQTNEPQKPPYQVDQQVKFMHLEAEVESLLQQLQSLKQQRLATTSTDVVKSK